MGDVHPDVSDRSSHVMEFIHGEMELENHPRYGKTQGDMSNVSGGPITLTSIRIRLAGKTSSFLICRALYHPEPQREAFICFIFNVGPGLSSAWAMCLSQVNHELWSTTS